MAKDFHYHRRVQFAETDLLGMVHFSWYYRYMEEAEHALWRSVGLSIVAKTDDYRFPRVAASFDFLAPLRFEDDVDIWIRVATVAAKTIRYTCTISREGHAAAEGTMTIACIRVGPGAPAGAVNLPPYVTAKLIG